MIYSGVNLCEFNLVPVSIYSKNIVLLLVSNIMFCVFECTCVCVCVCGAPPVDTPTPVSLYEKRRECIQSELTFIHLLDNNGHRLYYLSLIHI